MNTNDRQDNKVHPLSAFLRRIAPALGLGLLSPWVAEFLLGHIAIDGYQILLYFGPLYAGGAILIRELTRRAGRGWPTIFLLALAYGLIEEGLVTQSLFNRTFFDMDLLGQAYLPALGIGGWWTCYVLTLHTVWSIAVPIAISEAFVPARATTLWLGWRGLMVAALLFVIGAIALFRLTYNMAQFVATPAQLTGTLVFIGVLITAAFTMGRVQPRSERAAPRPRNVGIFSFFATTIFMVTHWFFVDWSVLIAYLVLWGIVSLTVVRWSSSKGWQLGHQLALAGGALLTYAWHAFLLPPNIGSAGIVDLIGNVVFALVALGLLVIARFNNLP